MLPRSSSFLNVARRVRRSGRTPKFKKSLLSNTERSVETRWVSEVDLQLWEVKYMLER